MTATTPFTIQRLKYVATINDEALSESTDPEYEIAYIDIGNVDSQGQIHDIVNYRYEDAPTRARRIVRDGDVIISTVRTYLQAIAPIENPPENLIVSTGFAVVRPSNLLDPKFCKYALRESQFLWEVEARSTGVSYPAINASDLGEIKISLPDIHSQRRIANYLDRETARIDSLIAEKERMLALLEEKRSALISRLVTRGLNPDTPLKPSGQEWLGDIPAHWKVLPLRWFTNIGSGEFLSNELISNERTEEMLVPVVGGNGVLGYTCKAIIEDALVIGRVGALCGNVHFIHGPVWVTDNALLVQAATCFDPRYLREILQLMKLNKLANQSAQPLITGEMVKSQIAPVPPIQEQKKILQSLENKFGVGARLFDEIFKSISLLKERRAALITSAVTGQIPLKEMGA
ncbi:restriction endonuclease subunit S [Vandammella animalimorsus]|uniref:Restriction endonuclease subunit S n=1 Tax=Vandammella animalimorsus TaxID=2029117 RepID=A0A3M6R6T1_9BURK|nr:restriction endonuclease subunit S [Vandammella animalimorsus]RMX10993.1 restriction endonuclease subunit S [Vandammella animalimorsus]